MIATMKKVTLLTTRAAKTESLERLRDLGLVHINARNVGAESVERLREQRAKIERAVQTIGVADETPAGAGDDAPAAIDRALLAADSVSGLSERRAQLCDDLSRTHDAIERSTPWGEIDPDKIAALERAGVRVRLAKLTNKQVKALPPLCAFVVGKVKSANLVAFVAVGAAPDPVGDTVPLPTAGVSELRKTADRLHAEIGRLDAAIEAERSALATMLLALEALAVDIEFAATHATMGGDKHLAWITGFIPAESLHAVTVFGRENGVGVITQDPDATDVVPTKLRNPAPVRIIRPVFDLLGTVPGYRELDISFFFLLFFMLFFAMIIGDGAYGTILLLGSGAFALKSIVRGRPPALGTVLLIVLSLFTIAWGAITGNWFGYAPLNDLTLLRDLVIPVLSIDNPTSQDTVRLLCFVIAPAHLTIAHIWNAARELRGATPIRVLVELGSLSLIAGAWFLVLFLVLDPAVYPIPPFAWPLIFSGVALTLLFGTQEQGRSFGRGLLASFSVGNIISTALGAINYFADIISYIRLYAVGLAGLAIAVAFNEMAAGVSAALGGGPLGIVLAALVLFLGHSLNLAMAALSVIVHGVRLNMLEFSQHLGMEWSGVAYAPFKNTMYKETTS